MTTDTEGNQTNGQLTDNPAFIKEGDYLFPRYTVIELMRRGKDCDVYHVWSEDRYCSCIGKCLRPDRLEKRAAKERLIREGEYLKRLTHPNLVRAYEVHNDPFPIMIQETLTGQTLHHLVKTQQNRRLSVKQLAHLGAQLCSVMHYLHQEGILHLDLKPSNIINQPPLAKVIDLSIAAQPGEIKKGAGTRQFMAPEQARGDQLTTAADIWGIGAVLFFAATGNAPFQTYDGNRYDQLERCAEKVQTCRRLPANFANIINRSLHPNPLQRPKIEEIASTMKQHY
ncbi:protein kinase [Virgibacillus dakarensis]|uniref:Protein kinase domain-containing protein n=1 Tax=Lentibacillus populi TaxID=1827502 RepID=A0A9W5TZP6_9BACI|nr:MULTISPECIES: serine/threonine-protein kinase [Bacillaceae]MBT2217029.1 serine/threonine protein kinase [Virgibacillus dakarensis]MTW86907.1 protein kinase [Virgibacillus dakarensis]GGB52393.1 hypothetical protein GCM10011409_32440 [Lentibacillus populi]